MRNTNSDGVSKPCSGSRLLDRLSIVERMEIGFGKETRIWYLNKRLNTTELLKKIGFGKLFDENTGAK